VKTTSISEIKNSLSSYIDQVRAGESILVTDRGVVVARLEPVSQGAESTGRLARLERAGLVRGARAAPPLDVLRTPAPRPKGDASALRALLDERRDAR
jgi:prevent-host-death family protein